MLVFAPTVEVYDNLRDMDEPGVSELSVGDKACRDEILRWLLEHGLNGLLGVTHLHKHLKLQEGEFLYRRRRGRGWVTFPATENTIPLERLVPVSVMLNRAQNGEISITALEYEEIEGSANDPIQEVPAEMWAPLYEILQRHGKLDRFGFAAIRDFLGKDEVLLEVTDVEERAMHMDVVPRNLDDQRSETFWIFKRDESGSFIVSASCCCWKTPYGHTQQHRYY
jgi:hypothetical protein